MSRASDDDIILACKKIAAREKVISVLKVASDLGSHPSHVSQVLYDTGEWSHVGDMTWEPKGMIYL